MSLERIGRKKADNGTYRDIFSAKEIRSLLYYQNSCILLCGMERKNRNNKML